MKHMGWVWFGLGCVFISLSFVTCDIGRALEAQIRAETEALLRD